MANHFAAIGIVFEGRQEFIDGVIELAQAASVHRVDDECDDLVWTDPSGARVVILTRGGSIQEILPCLVGGAAPVTVRDVVLRDAEVAQVELHAGDGSHVCPLLVELEDRALVLREGKIDSALLRLAALAEEISVHADEDAYMASQGDGEGQRPRFAANHLIPAGMFGAEPRAVAMLAGTVVAAEARTNTRTGTPFHWLRVRGIADLEFDVAVQDELVDGAPQVGNVVAGMFFMTGSLGLAY
ncbi:MAG TPA: hypothetical protein VL551_03285 [Actinospica sp.]|nr:hypothetical protein [Actinospica sp.]